VLPEDHPDAPGDAYAQTKHAFEIIETGLIEAGASVGDVVRTRVFLTNIQDADAVGQAHHEMFGATLPASAFIGVASLIGGQAVVEIEVDAVVSEAVG
jgi:enamine deaminase RidA (YjgF/YER057c/UK114 family)